MSDEWIIFLGASRDQVEGIKACQRLGYKVWVFDRDEQSPGFLCANMHSVISTHDANRIARVVDDAQFKPAGVLTMGSDIPHIVAELAEHFGVPSVSKETARLCTDKLAAKRKLLESGVPIPDFASLNFHTFRGQHRTTVVKPVDRSGSRGVFRLGPNDNFGLYLDKAATISKCGKVIVEEWIEGTQLSTETVMVDGRAIFTAIAERNYEHLERFAPRVIENGGWMPYRPEGYCEQEVKKVIEAAANALGITTGIAKGDLVWSRERGATVIEMACRLSGGHMSDGLIPLAYPNGNILEAAVNLAVGKPVGNIDNWLPRILNYDYMPIPDPRVVCNRYFFPPPGRLIAIWGLQQVQRKPWVHKVEVWPEVGDELPEIQSHADRSGVFVLEAPDRETMARRIDWVYDTLLLEVE
ncbi:MAG: ATP-grasp domain-containing protein [Planctomycetota bacterium]|jgi:biotin carboxylase